MIYLITPHLQQLQPCAEMLSVTTVPQVPWPGAFFGSLPKTGKRKIRTGFVLHTMYSGLYTTPQPFCAVYMCLLNLHNQVQKMSITIRTAEIPRILLISVFITCTCTLQCTFNILLLKGIPPFYYYFFFKSGLEITHMSAQHDLFYLFLLYKLQCFTRISTTEKCGI